MNDSITISELRDQRLREYKRRFSALELKLCEEGYMAALNALYYSRDFYDQDAMRKDGFTPAHMHEIRVAFSIFDHRHALVYGGIDPSVMIAVGLLHDIPEDHHDLTREQMKDALWDSPNTDQVVAGAFALSKVRDGVKMAPLDYYISLLANPMHMLVKLFDRRDNIRTIVELEPAKQPVYVVETSTLLSVAHGMHKLYPKLDAVTRNMEQEIGESIQLYLRLASVNYMGKGDEINACLYDAGLLHKPVNDSRAIPNQAMNIGKPLEFT